MKWGDAYDAVYVNRLYGMVARNLERAFRFVCFTDDPSDIRPEVECAPIPHINLPKTRKGSWRKLALFAPALHDLSGAALFLDLDVVITDRLDCFFEFPGDLCIVENWAQQGMGIGNSSVLRFRIGTLADVYERFNENPDAIADTYSNEQAYLSLTEKSVSLRFWPVAWVRSFKMHCVPFPWIRPFVRPRVPAGARIVAFHGYPKMDEAALGRPLWQPSTHPGRAIPRVWRPAPWINEHWCDW
jgi:hypothetical protein